MLELATLLAFALHLGPATPGEDEVGTEPPAAEPEAPTEESEAAVEDSGDDAEVEEPSPADDEVVAEGSAPPADEPLLTGGGNGGSGGGASGGAGAGGASGGAAAPDKAVASGSIRSDDDQFDDAVPEEDRRGRRVRRRDRGDEGQWQVLAPYPELGPIRYRDPGQRRAIWLGLDASGSWMPASLGVFDRDVWTVRPAGSWAVGLTPWLALGGRHEVAWYDAQNIRTRVHGHQVELSGRPLAGSRSDVSLDDRLAVGVSTHAIRWSRADDLSVEPGGLDDWIVHLGYGLDHLLGTRWRLGWQAQVRYAWVYQDTQRHARVSGRLAFHPKPAHRLSLDAVGYYVNRDSEPVGNPLPRHSVYGQFGLGYSWVGRAGVGPWLNVRSTTGFLSGEAPVYEVREESLDSMYGEALVGMLARWP